MTGTAIICGGSIGGLFAAAALRAKGWQVDVYERSAVELAGRGAGIVTHDILIDALNSVGAGTEALGVDVHDRVAFDLQGRVVASLAYFQTVTSWDRIHQLLRRILPDRHHHLGCAVAIAVHERKKNARVSSIREQTPRNGPETKHMTRLTQNRSHQACAVAGRTAKLQEPKADN